MTERVGAREGTPPESESRPHADEEARFKALVETSSDWIWETDTAGRYTYASPKVVELLGFRPEALLGRTPFDLMPAAEAEQLRPIFSEIVAHRRPFAALENVNIHRDGHLVVLETSGIPFFDEQGELAGYRGIDRDISERRRHEEEMRRSRGFERLVATLATELVDLPALQIDAAVERALGAIGSYFDGDRAYLFQFDDAQRSMDNTHEWCAPGVVPHRERLVGLAVADFPSVGRLLRSGETIQVASVPELPPGPERAEFELEGILSLLLVPMTSGGRVTGFLGIDHVREPHAWPPESIGLMESVGELLAGALGRARAERRVAEESAFRQAMISRLAEGLCVAREVPRPPGAQFTVWNERMAQITGRSHEEISRLGWDALFPVDEERTRFRAALANAARGVDLAAEHFQLTRADGSARAVLLSTSRLRGDDGSENLLVLCNDVTERRNLEEQLRQSQKLEAVGRLAGGIAHDFNNFLNAILGYSELLAERLEGSDGAALGHLEQIRRAAHRAAALTQQLLAFGRRRAIAPRVLDLNAVVAEMEPMLRRLIGEQIDVVLHLAPDLAAVHADPGQLSQVLMNLVVNARDAMPHGGRLTLSTANLPAVAGRSSGGVLLRIEDTGMGMDAATTARMFEPFFTTKDAGQGTGLGLSIVYGIVEESGGQVRCDSEPGRGTAIEIVLPAIAASPAAVVEARPLSAAVGNGGVVLVAEDEDQVRSLMVEVLTRAGYQVLAANNGARALEVASAFAGRIDALVSDVMMPELDGEGLARELSHRRPGLRILLTSGYPQENLTRRAAAHGSAFLAKPFAPVALVSALRELLSAPPANA